jgi:hypothetical protein
MSTNECECIATLRNRAVTGLLFSASTTRPEQFLFWRGYLKALLDLSRPNAGKPTLREIASGGYEPPAFLQRAWTALPERIERLTLPEVQQFLAAQGVEITRDHVSDRQFKTVLQTEGGEVTATDLNDEHPGSRVDVGDDAAHE